MAATNLKGQISQSLEVLRSLTGDDKLVKDGGIPRQIIANAKGIVFLTQIKAGFVFSGKIGTGIIIMRKPGAGLGWSAPSSIGTVGMGWGLQIGGQKTDTVIVLNSDSSVRAFSGKGQLTFGGNVAISAGPVGRDVTADLRAGDGGVTGCFSYSHSQGLFAGMTLEGSVVAARDGDNEKYYGRRLTVDQIFNDQVPPVEAEGLYKALNDLC